MSMKKDWWARIASTQLLLFYPIQSAIIFRSQNGWEAYATIGFVVLGGIILNYIFAKDLIAIFTSRQSLKELHKEYFWVVVVALMNISFFACIYHMFGIASNGEVLEGDWYHSFYFSIVTWTTLGYGDFSPVEGLRLIAAFESLIGYIYMAILVGLLLNISQHTMKPGIVSNTNQPDAEAPAD